MPRITKLWIGQNFAIITINDGDSEIIGKLNSNISFQSFKADKEEIIRDYDEYKKGCMKKETDWVFHKVSTYTICNR